eukprot:3413245-Pyramimonas_sp.AAC.1
MLTNHNRRTRARRKRRRVALGWGDKAERHESGSSGTSKKTQCTRTTAIDGPPDATLHMLVCCYAFYDPCTQAA